MKLTLSSSAGRSTFGFSPATTQAAALEQRHEEALRAWQCGAYTFGSGDNPFTRSVIRNDLSNALDGYLAQGFLPEGEEGPVQRRIETATDASGVIDGATNLSLRSDVAVFGFLDNGGDGDCYFVCWLRQGKREFYALCVASGASTGRYEIIVSGPWDWEAFLQNLA